MPEIYLVGGAVRDMLMDLKPHDYDFTVVADSFESMREFLEEKFSAQIFVEYEEYGTIRAAVPSNKLEGKFGLTQLPTERMAADFVLARVDGYYADGRRPEDVSPGSLYDDLARRDFTMNAIAVSEAGVYIDPFGGRYDIEISCIRAVGDPRERLLEDPLRAFRAIRFYIVNDESIITKGLLDAMDSPAVLSKLASVSVERIQVELTKAMRLDAFGTLSALTWQFPHYLRHALDAGLWFKPTLEKR